MTTAAVLTGDLIGSTRVEAVAVDRAIGALAKAAAQIGVWAGEDTRFTRFRGDGWQMYLVRPALVLRATLLLLAHLRSDGGGLETKLSIAVGDAGTVGPGTLAGANGAVFTLSGRNLDKMTTVRSFVYAEDDLWKPAVMDLAVWQAKTWSREQAEAVAMALDVPRPRDEDMARRLGISRQAVQARLKGAGLIAAHSALSAFEADHIWPLGGLR